MSCWHRFTVSVTDSWYNPVGGWTRLFKPLSWLFALLAERRKQRYLNRNRWMPPVPVVVVGNITVGGTGKTPLVTALVTALQGRGGAARHYQPWFWGPGRCWAGMGDARV